MSTATPASCSGRSTATANLVNKHWDIRIAKLQELFEKKGFAFTRAATLQEAADLVLNTLIPASKAASVSFGGSKTVEDSGLFATLKNHPTLQVLDTYDTSIPLEERIERRRQSLLVDFYIASANAITESGEVILLDGTCNRGAAVQFGPKHVVLLVGRNKLCADMHEGLKRVRSFAAPVNATRLNRQTPCVHTGHCADCNSPDRICSAWTILMRSNVAKRIHIVFIDQDAGF